MILLLNKEELKLKLPGFYYSSLDQGTSITKTNNDDDEEHRRKYNKKCIRSRKLAGSMAVVIFRRSFFFLRHHSYCVARTVLRSKL